MYDTLHLQYIGVVQSENQCGMYSKHRMLGGDARVVSLLLRKHTCPYVSMLSCFFLASDFSASRNLAAGVNPVIW